MTVHRDLVRCVSGVPFPERLVGAPSHTQSVLAIVAGILVARHLKTMQNLFDSRSSPRTESLVAAD
ncbi:MAG TPA: hypothetical protein VE957_05215 [Terriglobales bacterium]|nr:hypothetical protein [Terriglobales bacterium]